MNNEKPLVSIVVITYNSAKYVLETLESAKAQTYQNIELIISDDCSTDNTVELCRAWVKENASRFVCAKVIPADINQGVTINLNKGVRNSQGQWIKSIAGDDILKNECIEEYINFIFTIEGCEFCCCDLDLFSDDSSVDLKRLREAYDYLFQCVSETREEKIKRLIYEYTIPGPGFFYSRILYDEVGGFDEKYPMGEEFPFVYYTLQKGHQIYPLKKRLVNYRISSDSLCRMKENGLPNKRLFLVSRAIFYDFQLKGQLKRGSLLTVWHKICYYEITKRKYRYSENRLFKILSHLIYLTDPILVGGFVKRQLLKLASKIGC